MHIPLAQQQHQLILGELRVELRERDHVERQVPGGIPRVLPVIWHGNDVAVIQMAPIGVAALQPAGRRRRLCRVSLEPVRHAVVVELLGPQQAGISLARDGTRVVVAAQQIGVERVGILKALLQDRTLGRSLWG